MTIHASHPFLDPLRDPGRQLRGRLGSRVSLWCAGDLGGAGDLDAEAAGLTVSSMLLAAGNPWRVVALLDPDSALADALTASGKAAISLLEWQHRQLAEVFAGLAPSPGGPFRAGAFVQTAWGPRLSDADTWAGVSVESSRELGWSLEVTCVLETVELGDDPEPLHHVRGRYVRPHSG